MTLTPIQQILKDTIEAEGPINIADFMTLAMTHPQHGYYTGRDPFGEQGDFTTAPEISQIFGELIGVWVADIWLKIGAPQKFYLTECGPGRGTLMADMLRIIKSIPAVKAACHPCLVEISPHLSEVQRQKLVPFAQDFPALIQCKTLQETPNDAPIILIANELLDALPIHQLRRHNDQWQERHVDCQDDHFTDIYKTAPQALIDKIQHKKADEGAIIETSPACENFMRSSLNHMREKGGIGLFIDYGYNDDTLTGETLQALYKHKYCNIFDHIGRADLSAHVDFVSLAKLIKSDPNNHFCAVAEQGTYLSLLGGAYRAQALAQNAPSQKQAEAITSAFERLRAPDQMGTLFKVLSFVQGFDNVMPAAFSP